MFLKILFDMALFIIGVQTGIDPFLNHLGAEVTRRGLGDPALKDQLDPVRSTHIQIVSDDGFKPLPPLGWVSKDLSATEFDLPDG